MTVCCCMMRTSSAAVPRAGRAVSPPRAAIILMARGPACQAAWPPDREGRHGPHPTAARSRKQFPLPVRYNANDRGMPPTDSPGTRRLDRVRCRSALELVGSSYSSFLRTLRAGWGRTLMIEVNDWVGREIAGGRYKVLERLGVGSMGQVFLALDRHLETEVVVKCPVPEGAETIGDALLKRFDLEIRSLVQPEPPPDRQDHRRGGRGRTSLRGHAIPPRGQPPGPDGRGARRATLPDADPVALGLADGRRRALDFIHSQNYLHRDVKPENILFDRFGNAFLADFGIIKMLSGGPEDWRSNRMTAPGFLMGTPNYVAPEVVLGRGDDARIDQYSLAMTVHEVVTGSNCMEGPTPSATMVNQTKLEPPDAERVDPGDPRADG